MNERHLEVAAFGIAKADDFAATQLRLHRQLDGFDGCEHSIPLRGFADRSLFADIVLWRDESSAKRAAENLQPGGSWDWYSEPGADIRFFNHFPIKDPNIKLAIAAMEQAAVIEVVALKPNDAAGFESAHTKLHEHYLESMDSITTHVRLEANSDGLVGDINGWDSVEATELAFQTLSGNEELAPVFSEQNEVGLFANFSINQG